MLVICSVAALTLLTLLPFGGESIDDPTTIFVAALLTPGAFLAVSWLVRLVQWLIASRAEPYPATVTAHLAQTPKPSERGRAVRAADAVASISFTDRDPKGYATWLTFTDERGRLRHQRVIPARWLMSVGSARATVRQAAGVSIIDVDGHGRLWPASLTLLRKPRGVRLAAMRQKRPEDTYMSRYKLFFVIGLVVLPCALPMLLEGNLLGLAWAVGYVAALAVAVGTWFGVIPPGWRPKR